MRPSPGAAVLAAGLLLGSASCDDAALTLVSCGDGACDGAGGETCASCPADCACAAPLRCSPSGACAAACGDGSCEAGRGETCATCPADCACAPTDECASQGTCRPACGNGSCEAARGETCATCEADCGCLFLQECHEGACRLACGNGSCEAAQGETCATCEADCACAEGLACEEGACRAPCGNGACENARGETCATCPADCPCAAGQCAGGVCSEDPCASGACAGCAAGDRRRCWVECGQAFAPGCLHGGVEPLIAGVETCADGQWSSCATRLACAGLDGACTNGQERPASYECLDGSVLSGAYGCTLAIGAQCSTSYWTGWGPRHSEAEVCNTPGERCLAAGAARPCEVRCDSSGGRQVGGTERCMEFDGGVRVWGPCLTNDGCAP